MRTTVCRLVLGAVLVSSITLGFACKPRRKGGSGTLAVGDSAASGVNFTGTAPFKLVFINHAGANFNVNEDIVNPSSASQVRELVNQTVSNSILLSLLPMYGALT